MKFKYCIQAGVVALAATLSGVSCTDTWDDHYSLDAGIAPSATATIWQNLLQDESLRPFAEVLDTCGYDVILNSAQTYTVWAPVITEAEADQWIATYQAAKASGVDDEDNPTIRQFIRNHIALYNHQISELTSDTVSMMNGKRMSLTSTSFNEQAQIEEGSAVPSSNGVLYKLDRTVEFFPNIWERIAANATGGDTGLDSLYNFLLRWEREELDEEASVPGGVVDGETFYLDSVMYSYNILFNRYGNLDAEDSTYWFLAPDNKVWREQVEKNREYFNYRAANVEGDSLQDYYSKMLMLQNSFFNVAHQPSANFDVTNPDSICSTSYSSLFPGYHVFQRPLDAGGILGGLTPDECSNGRLYTTAAWQVPDSTSGFMTSTIIEAEYSDNYIARPRQDTANVTAIQVATRVASNPDYLVSNNRYLLVRDTRASFFSRPGITFKLPNILSNCPYRIKVVFATPLASDPTAVADASLKRQISAYTYHYTATGSMISPGNANTLCTSVDVDASRMDTVTVTDDYVFPVCTYGESDPTTYLTIESLDGFLVPDGYAQNLYIDCVILEPRPGRADGDN